MLPTLWIHYGDEMVALLTEDPFVPGTWWSARRDQARSRTVAGLGASRGMRPPLSDPAAKKSSRVMSKSAGANILGTASGRPGSEPAAE
jgi:hypothetical protein